MPDGSSTPASPELEVSFAALVDARRELAELTRAHRESVNFFACDWGFQRTASDVVAPSEEPPELLPLNEPGELQGVTTSLTCFESLRDAAAAAGDSTMTGIDGARLVQYATNALSNPQGWKSEGAARRYCIVRAAAPLVGFGYAEDRALRENVREVWLRVSSSPAECGIFEVGEDRVGNVGLPYPPNAFLTYWGLRAVQGMPKVRKDMQKRIDTTGVWLRSVVGREIAYHFARSPARDPQQLAWATCGVVIAETSALADRSAGSTETVRAALRAFFEQQVGGTWDRGGALFHYPGAGNAYCYTYETLAELISLALDDAHPAAGELRQMLRPYIGNLLDAKDYLARTGRPLVPDRPDSALIGWSSNHHPHRTTPESWATATAYRFLQMLRRLVAVEVRERAAQHLRARRPQESLRTLADRGDTWNAGRGSAGALLASLFVHPNEAEGSLGALDPDLSVLTPTAARSAILFGPPGTGKTTLAESVAGALGWQFVEVTPADFLDRGSEFVSARADEMFKQLMELDRCVVLFDEIDELIRRRDSSPEALSRFFTTTMLPRLARLWRGRKLIFFVNTNSIRDVDPAIIRSQRFDAAIYVLPPSLDRKLDMLGPAASFVDRDEVLSVFANPATKIAELGDDKALLAGIGFLRFDQMQQLQNQPPSSASDLRHRISGFCHELLQTDWAQWSHENGNGNTRPSSSEELKLLLDAYRSESEFQRVDATRRRLVKWSVESSPPPGFLPYESGVLQWVVDELPDGVLDGAAYARTTS
jgi:hypothetical protein